VLAVAIFPWGRWEGPVIAVVFCIGENPTRDGTALKDSGEWAVIVLVVLRIGALSIQICILREPLKI